MDDLAILKHRADTAADDGIYEWAYDEIEYLKRELKVRTSDIFIQMKEIERLREALKKYEEAYELVEVDIAALQQKDTE